MASPAASIIVNNYNYGRFLPAAVASALEQSCDDVEVIVVDDGSTDNSRDLILAMGDRIVPVLKANGGQASAINAGFARSRGGVVLLLDADDMLLPHAVERSLQAFGAGDAVKVQWPLRCIDERGEPTGGLYPDSFDMRADLRDVIARDGPGSFKTPPGGAAAWSRAFLEAVLPIPEPVFRNTADYYLLNLAPLFGRIRSIPEPLGCYRRHGGNDTMRPVRDFIRDFLPRYEECCRAASHRLDRLGLRADTTTWMRGNYYWRLLQAVETIEDRVPAGARCALIDDMQWQVNGDVSGRACRPFPERDGVWWGNPGDDDAAIEELERMRRDGVQYLIVGWPCFWYFEHYRRFSGHVRERFARLASSEHVVIFDLAGGARADEAAP